MSHFAHHRPAYSPPTLNLVSRSLYALLSGLLAGYDMVKRKRRSGLHVVLYAAVIALTIYTVLDLDNRAPASSGWMRQTTPSSSCAIPSGKKKLQSANVVCGVSTYYRLLCSADILTVSPEFPDCNLACAHISHKIRIAG